MTPPIEWRHTTLAEICSLRGGAAFKPNLQGRSSGDYPFIKVRDFNSDQNLIRINGADNWVDSADTASIQGRPFAPGTSVFAKIGEALKHNRVRFLTRPTFIDNNLMGAFPITDDVEPGYLFFLLRTFDFSLANAGTAVPYLTAGTLGRSEVVVPPLRVQRRIIALLGAYDDLIELNYRRIGLLEAIARQHFEEWFVHFHAPDCRMIEGSEYPVGWSKIKVGALLAKIPRKGKIQKQEYAKHGEFPCVDQGVEFVGGYTNDVNAAYFSPLPLVLFGDHTRILKFIDFPFACGADGTQLLYPNRQGISTEFLYFAIKNINLDNQHYARHFKYLKEEEVFIPSDELIASFTSVAKPCLEQIRTLRDININLKGARDMLLPQLISGELPVSEAKREFEAAA